MSSGSFINSFYETNDGDVCRIRVQPETELATDGTTPNDSATGPATLPVRAKVSRGTREIGIKPRRIGIKFEIGQAPTGYAVGQVYYLPALTRAFYDALEVGDDITYLAATAEVVSKLEEDIK